MTSLMEAKITVPDRFSTCVVIAALLTLTCMFGFSARADTLSIYRVSDVPVDVTADTAASARDQALLDGEAQAFRTLLERMTLKTDHPRLPTLEQKDVADFVQDISIRDEKTSGVRYIAKLTVRFREDAVRALLRSLSIPFAETPSKPLLILPVLQQGGARALWDDPNPWRDVWRRRPDRVSLVPTVLPLGDFGDVGAIGAEQAVSGDGQRLAAIADRYGAGSTAVALAELKFDKARSIYFLDVTLTRYNVTIDPQTDIVRFEGDIGEQSAELMARAAAHLTNLLEDNWKRDNLIESGSRDAIAVTIPIKTLGDWINIQRKLKNVAILRDTEVVLLSRSEVQVILHYIGDIGQLIIALEQADMVLKGLGDTWTLERLPGGT